MNLYILDNKKLEKYTLPNTMDEDYSIDYIPYNSQSSFLISLESRDNMWTLKSTGSVNVISNNMIMDKIVLQDYNFYQIKIIGIDYYIYIYTTPSENDCIYKLGLEKVDKIKIGNTPESQIVYNISGTNAFSILLTKLNTGWLIEQENVPFSIYINSVLLTENKKELKYGSFLFIGGLKIILMKEFIEINNPNNMVGVNGLFAYTQLEQNNKYSEVSEEDKNTDLYSEDSYFSHTPNIKEALEVKEIQIDQPPQNADNSNGNILMSIGMTITMLSSTFMTGYNLINKIIENKKITKDLVPQVIMLCATVIGTLLIPTISRRIVAHKNKVKEKKRQKLYTEYLDKKDKEISATINNQINIMNNNMPLPNSCKDIITNQNKNFWGRELQDEDFLTVRLGTGTIDSKIKIAAPEEHFSLEVDNLLQKVYDLTEKYKKTNNCPIDINLIEKQISAIVCDEKDRQRYTDSIIMQIMTLQSPLDLKMCIITNRDHRKDWEYAKILPHTWNETKDFRYYSENLDEAKILSEKLEEIFKLRRDGDPNSNEKVNNDGDKPYINFDNYYLIIVDDFKIAKNLQIINDIQKSDKNLGFSILYISGNLKQLPVACTNFIEIGKEDGAFLEKNITSEKQKSFKLDPFDNQMMESYSIILSNIPTITKSGLKELPPSLEFLEMYGVSKIEQLNISNRWKNNNPVNTLATPIGVQEDGELFKLNLHEKNHGPHGLVAGSTGSGKSEFIITYILSMAINYHPYEVQFVLIDYKGGGLAGAFENKDTGVVLPHLTGTITNLDVSDMNRTLVSIESELKRRQSVFNEVKDKLNKSTIDIYKYQKYYRDGLIDKPMAHLFIISDEFAELKSQQPEFMDELISIARIGRSLGVHLILATQKPSGVVNDQIWSNSKFKVCLKVQSKSDSMEMLKRPEAASIKEAGRFYLQVGYDDLFEIGQSGWSGAKYIPSDKILKKVDESINFISNTGEVVKSVEDAVVVDTSQDYGDQLTNIVNYIYKLGQKESIVRQKLWLDKIPEQIFIEDLKKKYNYTPQPYFINPVIGEYDDPKHQKQNLLNIKLTNTNTIIYGQTGSGKENLITTILYSSIIEHRPEEVNFYILDFGAETLKTFTNMPHVGEVITLAEEDKIKGVFEMINNEIDTRRELFTDYGGNYIDYCNNSGNKLPTIVTIINGYDAFGENYPRIPDTLLNLYRDGSKYGIVFIVSMTATNAMSSRMTQYFENQIALQLKDTYKYRDLLNADKGLIPASIFGRGITKLKDGTYEFQTGYFVEKSKISATVREIKEKLQQAYEYRAKEIPVIPQVVNSELFITEEPMLLENMPVGYSFIKKNPIYFDFRKKQFTPIVASTISNNEMNFIYAMIKFLSKVNNSKLTVFDAVQVLERELSDIRIIKDNFDENIVSLNNELIQGKENPEENIIVIMGIGSLISSIKAETKAVINNLFTNLETIKNTRVILIDVYEAYKVVQDEEWSKVIDKSRGIWLGTGITTQMAINVTNIDRDDRNLEYDCMGFVITKGIKEPIKYVVDVLVEEDDEDEE